MDKIFVKPSSVSEKSGLRSERRVLIVRDPLTLKELHEDGEAKPRSTYWLRRLRCGDVVEVKQPQHKQPTIEDRRLAEPKKIAEKKGDGK